MGAVLGRPNDQRVLGLLRSHGEGFLAKDPAKAASWFRKAAEGGDIRAQFLLARVLATGSGAPQDPGAALRWAESAARRGDTDAMILAGDLRRPGNPTEADAWYQQALAALRVRIAQRDASACLDLGLLICTGRRTPRDLVEGLAWMKNAERLGVRG